MKSDPEMNPKWSVSNFLICYSYFSIKDDFVYFLTFNYLILITIHFAGFWSLSPKTRRVYKYGIYEEFKYENQEQNKIFKPFSLEKRLISTFFVSFSSLNIKLFQFSQELL